METLHGPVPGENIFKGSGFKMMSPGSAIGRGRPFIEGPLRSPLAESHGFGKCALVIPESEYFVLEFGEVHRGWHRFIHEGSFFGGESEFGRDSRTRRALHNFSGWAIPFARALTGAFSHTHKIRHYS